MNVFQQYFRRRLAFSSYDAVQVANVRRALQQAGVQFKIKQHGDDIRGPALVPSAHIKAATEYRLYVDRDDVELARYLPGGGTLGSTFYAFPKTARGEPWKGSPPAVFCQERPVAELSSPSGRPFS